jgi:hypothetical protein
MMRILVTGSRAWIDEETIRHVLIAESHRLCVRAVDVIVVHGGARGADAIADRLAREYGCQVEVVQADWGRYGRAAGPIRNAEMVSRGAVVCLGFPIGISRGTRHCLAMAEAAGIHTVVTEGQTLGATS